jgi:phosphatidylserine/phosphatidylglycerophosphate/cardiolipin synthase-like enzyme/uncharacterized membrane protein YdjX (TVP38/TMEM64 family)
MYNRRILQPGRNCWRICRAKQVAFLVDGSTYFPALQKSLQQAKHQVLILAWDIHSRLKLVPDDGDENGNALPLAELIEKLVTDNPDLHINILSWDFSLLFSMSREWLPIYRLDWSTHDRIKFCLDDQYPLGASHHQKVVVIDDALAFAGGLDITRGRWDSPAHDANDKRRGQADGSALPIRPYHDVQMAVSGPAAAALGTLARERWRRGTGKSLPSPAANGNMPLPGSLEADLENVDIAIVRTCPAFEDYTEIREVEQLYLDSIAAAQDYIYIENQYFTAPVVADALAKRLAEENGPEIVLNLPRNVQGWLSRQSMDMMRIAMIRKLRGADRNNRFAVYYPDKPDLGDESINLHAKIMVIDDRFARVGSSNMNNRSMGLDTECDLAIEAMPDEEQTCDGIRAFRNRLLGEHLGCSADTVAEAVSRSGSLIRAIESLRNDERTLSPLEPCLPEPDEKTLNDLSLTDPERPVDSSTLLNHFVPEKKTLSAGKRIAMWVMTLLLLLGLAAAWRYSPLNEWLSMDALAEFAVTWKDNAATPLIVMLGFIIGGLLVIPVTALIIISVLTFGPWLGFVYAISGSFLSAMTGYGLGNLLGRKTVRDLAGKRINDVSRQLAKRGLLTMLVVRVIPVAPFTIINLVAGASHIRLRDFSVGTVLGMLPGILGITLLTDRVEATLRSPDWTALLTLVIVAALVFSTGYFLSRKLFAMTRREKNRASSATSE